MPDLTHGSEDHRSSGFQPGTKFSHYEITRTIGAGGMGEVYLATDTQLNRPVAIKFLSSHFIADADFKRRFVREAEATARLNHPNIVTIYEVGEHCNRPYFAMEFVEGLSLKQYVLNRDLPCDQILQLAIQIGDAIAAAHNQGVSHRDIKPANILLDAYQRPRLLDFGLARIEGSQHLTRTGSTLGTVQYMSPEQSLGEAVDHRTDLFSFGVVLYELLTGRNPFARENALSTAQAIISQIPEPLARYRANLPEMFQVIVSKLLEKDPALRYQSAGDVVADLKRMVRDVDSGLTITHISGTGSQITTPKSVFRSPTVLASGLILIAALAATYWFGFKDLGISDVKRGSAKSASWKSSIAVLPFRDFSVGQNQEFFCDGITDAIIGKLSSLEELKVISMTSVMRYKSPDRDLTKIGNELGVEAILEGSVQREGDRVRIRAQLIDVSDDAHLWSDTYDRELESIFSVQDEISHGIASVLKIKLLGSVQAAMDKRGTENLEAYSAYMQGRFYWRKRTEQHILNSISAFESAIGLDSGYAQAWCGLADAWAVLPGYSDYPSDSAWPKAREAARKALELDSELAEAYASMGLVLWFEDDFDNSRQFFDKSIELNPGYAWAHTWYSSLLIDIGEREEGIARLERSLELDPLNTVSLSKLINFKVHDCLWDEAERLYRRTIEIEPNARYIAYYAQFLSRQGRHDEAREQYQRVINDYPRSLEGYIGLAQTESRFGSFDSARAIVTAYGQAIGDTGVVHYYIGQLLSSKSRYREAIREMTIAVESDPSSAAAWSELAYFQNQIGLVDQAIASATRQIELMPNNEYAWSLRGRINMMNGRFEPALDDFRQSVKIAPNYYEGINYQINVHLFKQDHEQAQKLIDRLKQNPVANAQADAGTLQAVMYTMRGQLSRALEHLDSCIVQDSLMKLTHLMHEKLLMKVFIFEELGRIDDALVDLQRYIASSRKHNPGDVLAWRDYLPHLLAQKGQYELALEEADNLRRDLLNRDRNDDLFGFQLAKASVEFFRQNFDTALALYKPASANNYTRGSRNFFQTEYMLNRSLLASGDYVSAIEGFETLLANFSHSRIGCEIWMIKARLHLAQAYELNGQTEEAIDNYKLFLSQWQDADPGLNSVGMAKAKLQQLTG